MDIFHINYSLKTYTYPVIKIVFIVVYTCFAINRGYFLHINNRIIEILIDVICVLLEMACILAFYIAIFELSEVHENRKKVSSESSLINKEGKSYSIEKIKKLVEGNDIIEIQILSKNHIIDTGSSADCKINGSEFFDKRFYVNDKEFGQIDDYLREIRLYSVDEQVVVISIDGIELSKTEKNNKRKR